MSGFALGRKAAITMKSAIAAANLKAASAASAFS
jgi:hypothetical protein